MSSATVEKRLYSLPDASARLGDISVWSLRRQIEAGNIVAVRVGNRVFIPVPELERIEQFGVGQAR